MTIYYFRFDDEATGEVWQDQTFQSYKASASASDPEAVTSAGVCGRVKGTGELNPNAVCTKFITFMPHPDAPTNTKVIYSLKDVDDLYPTLSNASAETTYSATRIDRDQAIAQGWVFNT